MAKAHAELAPAGVQNLARAALRDTDLVDVVIRHGAELFTRYPQIASRVCGSEAAEGSLEAVRLLLLAEAEADTCGAVITRWLAQESPDDRAGLSRAELVLMGEDLLPSAVLAAWAQPLAEQASHPVRGDRQRWALDALSIAAAALPSAQRQPYVALALAAARGNLTLRKMKT